MMLMILADIGKLPIDIPDTPGKAVIAIAVVCMVVVMGSLGFCIKWCLRHIDNLTAAYANESERLRVMFAEESKASRASHAIQMESMEKRHEDTMAKSFSSFERALDQFRSTIEQQNKFATR